MTQSTFGKCDFCCGDLIVRYVIPGSVRGMQAAVCAQCGLTQSLQTKPKPAVREVKASSEADWGNIRHGKGLRMEQTKPVLERSIPWDAARSVLDIGANRGAFVLWAKARNPRASITALEPDTEIVQEYRNVGGIETIVGRIEDVRLEPGSFDVVYCAHTLEHVRSATETIEIARRCLRNRGHLFLEVPNIDTIGGADIVEEFFIDKHTFHFNRSLLLDMLRAAGFEISFGASERDFSNITIVARKTGVPSAPRWSDPELPQKNAELISRYRENLQRNRGRLMSVAGRLSALADRQAVVCWGGGRILDALVKFGGLDPTRFRYIIDKFLFPHLRTVHGVPLHGPEQLRMHTPDVVVVLARNSAPEIERAARSFGVRHVVRFQDLLTAAWEEAA